MSLTPGTRFGPYEIISPLGAGGMGEVYRARDTRLGREVAIKVLPLHLSGQPEIRARFEREAKTVSSLNHPNICVLFDVGCEGDIDYLVMELVEGGTLAERLQRGPLSNAELLRFGVQIADALDRAHRAGVIHRDLKPANVMLTKSGIKLMDFGLSRVTGMAGAAGGSGRTMSALTQSPTMAQALTAEGTLLGTFQYMAPEQLEGREADARSDIWALGCVLYEMATGRRAFEGRSQASLIAAILERQPTPVGEAPSGAPPTATSGPPPGIERLIRNCLAKDPEERIQTAHDVKLQLQGIAEGAGLSSASVVSAPAMGLSSAKTQRSDSRLAWAIAVAGLIAVAGVFAWLFPRANAPSSAYRFRAGGVPGTVDAFWPRVSPDGKYLLVDAVDSTGTVRAFVRPMNQLEFLPVPGTENLTRAYWSPDSREVLFVSGDKIQRVPIAGGSPVTVCAAGGGSDLSWGSKGSILMDGRYNDSLRVVPAGGGELKPATRLYRADNEIGSAWPCFLPDGEHFLFIGNAPDNTGGNIRLGRMGSLDSKKLGHSDGRVEYAPGGWVLFLRGTTLLAQKLDLGAARLTGEPITIAEGLRVGDSRGHFSASRTGVLAFARGDNAEIMMLQAADRSGAFVGQPLLRGAVWNPELSPDGKRLLYQRTGAVFGSGGEINLFDLERGTDTRITFTGDMAVTPHWSPEGRRFAFLTRTPAGATTIHIGGADGMGRLDSVGIAASRNVALTQWAAAGSRLVYFAGKQSFAVASESTDRTPQALTDSLQVMVTPMISPDGRWLAGTMGRAPTPQVFVQSLSGPTGRWQVSTAPGYSPEWSRNGRELVYETWDGHIAAVDIDTRDGFHAGTPHVLLALPRPSAGTELKSWTVTADGERFYLVVPPRNQNNMNIEVVTNFHSLVNRK